MFTGAVMNSCAQTESNGSAIAACEISPELNILTWGEISALCDSDAVDQLSIDKIIYNLFISSWTGAGVLKSLTSMKEQLHKNLGDQVRAYWSGSSAYSIMTKGGFLIDGKSGTNKKLTPRGHAFMQQMLKDGYPLPEPREITL